MPFSQVQMEALEKFIINNKDLEVLEAKISRHPQQTSTLCELPCWSTAPWGFSWKPQKQRIPSTY